MSRNQTKNTVFTYFIRFAFSFGNYMKKARESVLFSTMCSAAAERDVPFGRDVCFASDVRFAREKEHITSLCGKAAIHRCAVGTSSLARQGNHH